MFRTLLYLCLAIAFAVGVITAVQVYCARYHVHGTRRAGDSGQWSFLSIPVEYRPRSGMVRIVRSHRAWSLA